MPWQYPCQIWLSDDGEGWRCVRGELIYTDGTIGRVKTDEGIIEAPVHRIYIYSPLVMFFNELQRHPISGTGRYGTDGPFKRQQSFPAAGGPKRTTTSKRNLGVSDEEEIFG